MKFAIISDTHFGDDTCTLIEKKKSEPGAFKKGPKFNAFLKAVGTGNDYLVMAGDIFDFSISSYEEAYKYAQAFFKFIKEKKVAREIIYIPGNHDADIWHIMQHQRAVINKLEQGESPKQYQHATPGILNDKSDGGDSKGFWLHGVRPCLEAGNARYGGMFLDKITGIEDKEPTVFNFCYPNLYIITDDETVLVTHGQYMDSVWSSLGEFVLEVTEGDLEIGSVDIEEMMELNYPINQLLCTGVGQAGVLTERLVRPIEQEVKSKNYSTVERYINKIEKLIDKKIVSDGWFTWFKELASDKCVEVLKNKILEAIHSIESPREQKGYFTSKEQQERFKRYYAASVQEIDSIRRSSGDNGEPSFSIPFPNRVIFGHTHKPMAWNAQKATRIGVTPGNVPNSIRLHNCGGWLQEEGKPFGAEVFTYETAKGFNSVSVSAS